MSTHNTLIKWHLWTTQVIITLKKVKEKKSLANDDLNDFETVGKQKRNITNFVWLLKNSNIIVDWYWGSWLKCNSHSVKINSKLINNKL